MMEARSLIEQALHEKEWIVIQPHELRPRHIARITWNDGGTHNRVSTGLVQFVHDNNWVSLTGVKDNHISMSMIDMVSVSVAPSSVEAVELERSWEGTGLAFSEVPEAYSIAFTLEDRDGIVSVEFLSCLHRDRKTVERIRDLILCLHNIGESFTISGIPVLFPITHQIISVDIVCMAVVPF